MDRFQPLRGAVDAEVYKNKISIFPFDKSKSGYFSDLFLTVLTILIVDV